MVGKAKKKGPPKGGQNDEDSIGSKLKKRGIRTKRKKKKGMRKKKAKETKNNIQIKGKGRRKIPKRKV